MPAHAEDIGGHIGKCLRHCHPRVSPCAASGWLGPRVHWKKEVRAAARVAVAAGVGIPATAAKRVDLLHLRRREPIKDVPKAHEPKRQPQAARENTAHTAHA